jgi:surface protein
MTYQTERDEMGASITEYVSDITPTKLASAITETTQYVESLRETISNKAGLDGISIQEMDEATENSFFSDSSKLNLELRNAVKGSQGLKFKPKGSFIIKIDTRYEYSTSWNEAEQRYIDINVNNKTIDLGYTGSFTIDWGDGTVNGINTHSYAVAGEYTISITGVINSIQTNLKEVIKEVVQFGDLCVFNTMSYLFYNASGLDKLPSKDWPTIGESVNASYMFRNCHSFNQDISHWDVSSVVDMSNMFRNCYLFNQPLDQWDVSNVINMRSMLNFCYNFNQPLNGWDTSNVQDTTAMFRNCHLFNQPLDKWDVSNVIDMRSMLQSTNAFYQDLSMWNVAKVTNSSYFNYSGLLPSSMLPSF